jgi:hypothetical protein
MSNKRKSPESLNGLLQKDSFVGDSSAINADDTLSLVLSEDSETNHTITFRDRAWGYPGQPAIGALSAKGLGPTEFDRIVEECCQEKIHYQRVNLRDLLPKPTANDLLGCTASVPEPAELLIIEEGMSFLLGKPDVKGVLLAELKTAPLDAQAISYGKIVTRRNQQSACFGDTTQLGDVQNKMCTINNFADYPTLSRVRSRIEQVVGCGKLVAETNDYIFSGPASKRKRGKVMYHGDSEGKIVVGLRQGGPPMKLSFQWFLQSNPIGVTFEKMLPAGTLYFMSEKATGFDSLLRKKLTLRHAAGEVPSIEQITATKERRAAAKWARKHEFA